jgi:MFS family permease
VYHLSSSPFLLGVVGFSGQIATLVLAPFAGVWVDRVNRHKLIIVTQTLSMLQSLALAGFALTNTITIHHIIVLSLIGGTIDAFDIPARQSMVVHFVERKEHLGNAIALNSSMFNLARLIGPAIAGFVIAAFGAGGCFLIDGISYLAVILALLAMRLRPQAPRKVEQHPLIDLRQGFSYAFGFSPIRALIILVAAICFAGLSCAVLTPMFARDVYHGDARTLGLMMSASGVGALIAALYLSGRKSVRGLGLVIAGGGVSLGTGLIGFALSRWLPLSLFSLAMVGLGGVLVLASSNTLVQTFVEDDKRGRVMSIFTTATSGAVPIGNLMMGALAGRIGAPVAVTLAGVVVLAIIAAFYRFLPRLRAAAAPALARSELEVNTVS